MYFMNESVWISNKISLEYVPKGPIDNITALAPAKPMIAWVIRDEIHVNIIQTINIFLPIWNVVYKMQATLFGLQRIR